MKLIATTDFHYGYPDAEGRVPAIFRGQEFDVLPTATASVAEQYRYLKQRGTGMTQEEWDKRSAKGDESYRWAKAEIARLNGGAA